MLYGKVIAFTTSENSMFVSSRFISNEVKCKNVSPAGFPERINGTDKSTKNCGIFYLVWQ
jgi:hypothetical protein